MLLRVRKARERWLLLGLLNVRTTRFPADPLLRRITCVESPKEPVRVRSRFDTSTGLFPVESHLEHTQGKINCR